MTVTIPRWLRLVSYAVASMLGGLGTPTIAYLTAESKIDAATATYLALVVGGVVVWAGALALGHLSLDKPLDSVPAVLDTTVQHTEPTTPTVELVKAAAADFGPGLTPPATPAPAKKTAAKKTTAPAQKKD